MPVQEQTMVSTPTKKPRGTLLSLPDNMQPGKRVRSTRGSINELHSNFSTMAGSVHSPQEQRGATAFNIPAYDKEMSLGGSIDDIDGDYDTVSEMDAKRQKYYKQFIREQRTER